MKLAERTVYILGAGFSCPAGLPPQAGILERIAEHEFRDPWMERARREVAEFIREMFVQPDSGWTSVALEDVHTLIDRALAREETLRGYAPSRLRRIRVELALLVTQLFDSLNRRRSAGEAGYVERFAEHLADNTTSISHGTRNDSVAVLSLNWDIVLDHALLDAFYARRDPDRDSKDVRCDAIDYGTYYLSLETSEGRRVVAPDVAAARRLPTMKLLKLHGSMNWLTCPGCDRLFVRPHEKIALRRQHCRFCGAGGRPEEPCASCNGDDPACPSCSEEAERQLKPLLVSPTFLKDLQNIHVRRIWNEAQALLVKAEHVVFIGYSFPQADFELRYLLGRSVTRDARITVCDYAPDFNRRTNNGRRDARKRQDFESRYDSFFGSSRIDYAFHGVQEWLDLHLASV